MKRFLLTTTFGLFQLFNNTAGGLEIDGQRVGNFSSFNVHKIKAGSLAKQQSAKIIYGNDDRHQTDEYPDSMMREAAKSVAGMVRSSKLFKDPYDETVFDFPKKTAAQAMDLCDYERFSQETVLPVCSGFLVGPDTLVTAGHCITNEFDCANYSWVFDYKVGTEKIKKSNVFKCKEILNRAMKYKFWSIKDYAVIKLDRVAKGRTPLKYRKKGRPFVGTKLTVIGHPSGLPQKIADNGRVKFANLKEILLPFQSIIKRKDYFIANLDTYAGNSGSPVFNSKKGIVEGILVQGGEDYIRKDEEFCNVSNRRSNIGLFSSEVVMRMPRVKGIPAN